MNAPLPPQSSNTYHVQQNDMQSISALLSEKVSDPVKMAVLHYRIDQIIKQNEAAGITTSVNITDQRTGRAIVSHNSSEPQFAASINKLPIAWLLLQDLRDGKVHLSDTITWQASDVRGGYGTYDQAGAPLSGTVEEVLQDMLNKSGNTAVRAIVNYELGGATAVNNRLAAYPQLVETRLQPLDATRFYLGNSTSAESLWIMQQLQKTHDSYEKIMQHDMSTNIFVSFGVRSQLEGNSYIELANKVGILDDPDGNNRHDVGVIYNSKTGGSYAYSFMTTNFDSTSVATMQAEASLQQMGRDTLRTAGDKPAKSKGTAPQAQALKTQDALRNKKILY